MAATRQRRLTPHGTLAVDASGLVVALALLGFAMLNAYTHSIVAMWIMTGAALVVLALSVMMTRDDESD